MKDGIIKGNGASRYLKTIPSGLSQYPTYEDFMQALIEGTFPIDLFGRNPGGWTQEGTLLNKSSLLTDETAEKYGLGSDATINDVFQHLSQPIFVPAGAIFWLAAESIPAGFLKCDGSVVSRTLYAKLFAVIGTKFGSGDGGTTFSLPDMRAAFVRGAGSQNGYSATFAGKQNATEITNGMPGNAITAGANYYDKNGKTGIYNGGGSGTGPSWAVRPYNIALTPIIKY